MNSFFSTSFQFCMLLLASTLLASGCSSSEPSSGDAPTTIGSNANSTSATENIAQDDVNNGANNKDDTSPNNGLGGSTDQIETDTAGQASGESTSEITNETSGDSTITSSIENDSVVPDPEAQNTTRVDFDITVPVYVSNALQVKLVWGDKTLTAQWVGDEYWSASADFPIATQQLLQVTFYDRNGDIVLGRFETEFRTGTNASEAYQVTADQLNTAQWDKDNDGVSNLNELVHGTDPLMDDRVKLEVRESFSLPIITSTAWNYYESRMPEQRPVFQHSEEVTPRFWGDDDNDFIAGLSKIVTINLDEFGTGTFSDTYLSQERNDTTTEDKIATRTVSDNGIVWMGTYDRFNVSAGVGDERAFTVETKMVDTLTRTQTGTIVAEGIGYGSATFQDIEYNLTGKIIDDTNSCEPIAGSIVYERRERYSSGTMSKTTISKTVDDTYWNVNVEKLNGDSIQEYLVQSLAANFYCNFVEFQ